MILFDQAESTPRPLFDLTVDGRAVEYGLEPDEFSGALSRTRLDLSKHEIFIQDASGYRERLGR